MASGNCAKCANPINDTGLTEVQKVIEEKHWCFHCAYWYLKSLNPPGLIIGHSVYTVGPETRDPSSVRGFAGRRFVIEHNDGTVTVTTNLWHGGEIPEEYWDVMPDTARFMKGAKKVVVDGITCWEESEA